MRININLTAAGLSKLFTPAFEDISTVLTPSFLIENYKTVLSIVYEYLSILRASPPLKWCWEESAQLGRIAWRFKEKGQPQSTVRNLATTLSTSRYPPSKTLVASWYASQWDENEVREVLECIKPEKGRVFVGSKGPIEGREMWKEKEKVRSFFALRFTLLTKTLTILGSNQWYGTEYDIFPLDVEELAKPTEPRPNLSLARPNIFVPSKLDLLTEKPVAEPTKRPLLTHKSATSRLFFKQDDTWCIPRASIFFLFKT